MTETKRYQLRHAAGQFWLLDMQQEPEKYRAPVAMNETGAMILEHYWKRNDPMDAARALSETYEISLEEALPDVKAFLEELRRQGIVL